MLFKNLWTFYFLLLGLAFSNPCNELSAEECAEVEYCELNDLPTEALWDMPSGQ